MWMTAVDVWENWFIIDLKLLKISEKGFFFGKYKRFVVAISKKTAKFIENSSNQNRQNLEAIKNRFPKQSIQLKFQNINQYEIFWIGKRFMTQNR